MENFANWEKLEIEFSITDYVRRALFQKKSSGKAKYAFAKAPLLN